MPRKKRGKKRPAGTHTVTVGFSIPTEFRSTVSATAIVPTEIARAYRPEFFEALALLAQACDDMAAKGYDRPVLVGGAAVEIHTGGAVTTADFDFVTPRHEAFEKILLNYGFVEITPPGRLRRTFHHPTLDLGAEVVSDLPFDGRSDPLRVQLVEIVNGKAVGVLPVEDLIADRVKQHLDEDRPEMRDQAIKLFQLAMGLDTNYLEERIRAETLGELGVADLKRWIEE